MNDRYDGEKPSKIAASRLAVLESFKHINHLTFNDISLLDIALTHRSFSNETTGISHQTNNERLEFLGDAILGQCVASFLYKNFPERPEGELARIKSIVVSEKVLAPLAVDLGIPDSIQLGKGEESSGGKRKKAILADCVEALIAAVFLDQGNDAAFEFVKRLLEPKILEVFQGKSKDYKTILQEYSQKFLHEIPNYTIARTDGPEHERHFWVACELGKKTYGPFEGKSKKEAEQNAAYGIFRELESESPLASSRLKEIATLK
jgi:ribonuclease-3